MRFNFGQPTSGIIQTAYVVPDIHAAMRMWIEDLQVGPWFLLDNFVGVDPHYRGEPTTSGVALAMAFAGSMQIELIQPNDKAPSVYKEIIDKRGHGFHHWGVASADVEADRKAYIGRGFHEAFRVGVPTGGTVYYLDSNGALPGFIELIAATSGMEETFTRFYLASVGWNGQDPVRPFQ
jgi:hypothetical protein